MTSFSLQLRPAPSPAQPATAWLIRGEDPRVWIEEIAEWDVPMGGLRLFVMPRSIRDRRPSAVLVTGFTSAPRRDLIRRALGYRSVADRLYLPVDAVLFPPVSDDELRQKLVWDVGILHPSIGLIGYRREEALGIADLLSAPPRLDTDWDRAAAPVAIAPKLIAVEPEQPPTLQTLIQAARDDIGSEPMDDVPADEDESPLRDLLERAGRPGFKTIQWLASAASAAGGSWNKKLGEWATRHLQAIDETLIRQRFRELERLQKLFEKNIDQALRYAIPFRDAGGRGAAPPGGQLTPRQPFYDFSRLRGGRPTDSWDIPSDISKRLIAQYRAAANRELNLGRYRRAAYIFAELLGDYANAANALQQGRFFRDAATLYLEKLNNKAAAANCLRSGGLLTEAAALFEELGEYERAGDLYETLESAEDSRRCYRLAVERAEARHAFVEAARLLETKLETPDEAAKFLIAQWPGSRGAAACLTAYFELLTRRQAHAEVASRIEKFRDAAYPDQRTEPLVEIFVKLANTYPTADVRALAADATRVVSGRRLATGRGTITRSLVDAVARLSPEDRLLRRDATRYLERRPAVYTLQPPTPKTRRVAKFRLPGDGLRLASVTPFEDGFFAFGIEQGHRTVVARATWAGEVQALHWPGGLNGTAMVPIPSTRALLMAPLGGPAVPMPTEVFPPSDEFPHSWRVESPAWLPSGDLLGFAADESENVWVSHSLGNRLASLSTFRPETSKLLSTFGPFTLPPDGDGDTGSKLTPLAIRKGEVYIVIGAGLWHGRPKESDAWNFQHADIWSPRPSIAVAPPSARRGVAVTLAQEGALLLLPTGERRVAQGMTHPLLQFTRAGHLIAVAGTEACVYVTGPSDVRLHVKFELDTADPLAVCHSRKLNQFGVISSNGDAALYEFD